MPSPPITAIEVRDFQSIGHARIELGWWTSLVGESDIGKSAMVRALHALLTNWRGDHFIRHGSKETMVEITLADTTTVTWAKKRGGGGTYVITPPGGGRELFEKTGGEVPADVRALVNASINVAGDPITPGLQQQHDPPFLFADVPRKRAQILGEFDGSNILMLAEATVRRDQRASQQEATAARADMESATTHLQQYDGVEDAMVAAERASATMADMHAIGALHGAQQRMLVDVVHGVDVISAAADQLCKAETALDHGAKLGREMVRLQLTVSTGSDMAAQVRASTAAAAALADAPPITLPHADQIAMLAAMVDLRGDLQHNETDQEALNTRADVAEAQLAGAAAELAALVGDACPVCGQPLTAEGLGV